uniref:Claspin n=1 Tax=Petromyzon marinus TaxID=7757 RepID=S4RP04_PETMA
EEESLEAIKSSMKKKAQKYRDQQFFSRAVSGAHQDDDDEEEAFLKKSKQNKGRVERKAAKAGRAAIQQLHSESQRIIRESNMSLPYHLPEPRSVHDFFKRRPLPAGDAMSLLKSTKYQADMLSGQGVPQSSVTQQSALAPEDACDPQAGSSAAAQGGEVGEAGVADAAVTCRRLSSEGDGAEMTRESERTAGRSGDGDDDGRESTAPPAPGKRLALQPDNNDHYPRNPTQPPSPNQQPSSDATPPLKLWEGPVINSQPQFSKSRVRARLLRLQGLGVDLSVRPTLLRAAAGTFIDLEEPTPNQGLNDLKERFLKHATRKSPMRPRGPVEIRVTRKETGADGKQQLLQEVLTVTVGDALEKPGAKLLSLKAHLQEAMRLRRLEERQKRMEAYELDNEEGFQEEEEDGDEELTDEESDAESGGPDDEGPDEITDYFEMCNSDAGENRYGIGDLSPNGNQVIEEDISEFVEPGSCVVLTSPPHLSSTPDLYPAQISCLPYAPTDSRWRSSSVPTCDESGRADEGSSSRPSLHKDESHNSSFELMASSIPPYQPPPRRSRTPSAPAQRTPSPFSPMSQFAPAHFSGYSALSTGKLSETSLRMEDSEDLYQPSPERPGSPTSLPTDSEFRFSLGDESQSQLLDADGYLNVGRNKAHKIVSSKRKLNLLSLEENAMHSDMDELVGMCSGKFELKNTTPRKRNSSEMDELVGLCSGKFESQDPRPTLASLSLRTQDQERTNSDMGELLGLCSGNFESQDTRECTQHVEDEDKGVFDVLTDDEALSEEENKDEQDSSDAGSDDEEEEEEVKEEGEDEGDDVTRSHFVEEEAELSGSEAGSDEDFSGNEEDNEYEEEDIQEELPSDDELQDQVKRLHMKALLDEDKRQLRLYQEVLLPDGDLHSDGPGRRRTFRWKNLDDSSQVDLFPRDEGDAEGGEHELEEHEGEDQEVQRRKERFEREKWIREKLETNVAGENADEDDVGEDSQFLKLAKKITAKSLQKRSGPLPLARAAGESLQWSPFQMCYKSNCVIVKSGSFLNKPRELLEKLASMSDPNPSAVRGASRNFVFHALSPGAGRGSAPKPQERKPQPSPKRARTASKQPGPKQPPRSVFRYLND